ncbi:hypothetical protein Hypma_002304 [Hypsizygus marmoreus]|uniref:receptor protein-tyrosine kinase n=1 Tax=Hypsizygus marmoreus TaxID=39966 RepID=A0A369KAB3_HYPMA|nr:hypothetical protein Hypma_002304 [Hypsizygus marmoreus]
MGTTFTTRVTPLSSALLTILTLPTLSAAYSWNFKNPAQQCQNLTIAVSGSDGKPPYRVLILPFGPSPLAQNIEARRIVDQPFSGNDTTVSFQLKYPANSQFVAVVSDATGFGSGGTSVAAEVTTSSDASCFDSTTNVAPDFVFSIEPPNQIVQCQATRIWWDKSKVQGTPNFLGLIPGGQSFAIPEGKITDIEAQGTGFSWTPSLRGGTTIIVVGGDERGNGTAGSTLATVSSGPNNDGSCLSDSSPSSTPGSPAGGTYPTSSTGSGVGGTGGGGINVGAIVGGVIGGVVFLVALFLILFFLRRRQQDKKKQKERPMDLIDEGDDAPDAPRSGSRANELPEYYHPEPFMVPDPTVTSTDGDTLDGRPTSGYTSTSRSGTPDLLGSVYGYGGGAPSSASGRKGPLRQMRPVNVIQHDDAGPSEPPPPADEEVETVELPPAYTNIKK